MNRIERVKAAIHFTGPDRPPVFKAGLADFFPMMILPPKSWAPGHLPHEDGLFPYTHDEFAVKFRMWRWKKPKWAKAPKYRNWLDLPRKEVDEWGTIWYQTGKHDSIGHPVAPALESWDDYDEYLSRYNPDPKDETRYQLFTRLCKLLGKRYYRLAILWALGPFGLGANIRGFNQFLIDHRKHPEHVKKLLAHITDIFIESMRMWHSVGANPHGFIIYDDLGDQLNPFMSPGMFKEFYEPVYRRIIEEAHRSGCDTILHSCGKVDPLIPHFIEWGLDAFEFDSPRMCGYPDLAPYRGKIAFFGCVNIQTIYSRGTPEQCRREVWHMIRNLGTEKGGFGAYFYPEIHHIGASKENVRAFEQGLRDFGVYANIPKSWWEHPAPEEWPELEVPPLPPAP